MKVVFQPYLCTLVLSLLLPQTGGWESMADLSKIYTRISSAAYQVEHWPDSHNFLRNLDQDENGKYIVPSFPDEDGPIGIFAMLDTNRAAQTLLRKCLQQWESFCRDLQEISGQQLELLQTPSHTNHITVAILQEHPRLLHNEQERAQWNHLDDDVIQRVATKCQTEHATLPTPVLELDSLLLTPDGAMIAGFVDRTDDAFAHLRTSSISTAKSIVESLTSRPKNLIHVTLGRVLELPEESSRATELVQRYNEEILPQFVESLEASSKSFPLTHVSMVRNLAWLLLEYKIHATWAVGSGDSTNSFMPPVDPAAEV